MKISQCKFSKVNARGTELRGPLWLGHSSGFGERVGRGLKQEEACLQHSQVQRNVKAIFVTKGKRKLTGGIHL